MQIINDPKLDFKDVLIMPKVSYIESRAEVDLTREFKYVGMDGEWYTVDCVPIIASNMDGVGTFSMSEALIEQDCMTTIVKHKTFKEWEAWMHNNQAAMKNTIMSLGMMQYPELIEVANWLDSCWNLPYQPKVCLDVANGYNQGFVNFVKLARETLPVSTFIIAGNVVTPAQTEQLILAGANAVKVGIGSGSVCTTRKVTGVGYPQLSAIIECADAAHGLHGFVVADGGCQVPGDVAKAFAAGADFVMLGGMLAGHDESEMKLKLKENAKQHTLRDPSDCDPEDYCIDFYGSSSKIAQELHGNGLSNYRSSEGKSVEIPYRGPVCDTIQHILGGVRSCCTYVGASKLKDLSKRTTFIRVYNGAQYNTVFGDSNEVS